MIELWRTDIHGSDFFMRRFADAEEAERVRREFEDRGHRQAYWLKRADPSDGVDVRIAGPADAASVAVLRALWLGGEESGFDRRMAEWLESEGERRTTWLALRDDVPVGMASLFEYRRMPKPGRPDERWGYVGNVFVREDLRGRGVGSELLDTLIAAADERDYVRLVVSPSREALPFFRRAGFVVPDGEDGLLVRRR